MGDGGLRFQLAGFPVTLPWGGLIGVLLIAYLWAPNFAGPGVSGFVMAGIFAVALYVTILLHELAHAWTARRFGFPVQGITLWLLGGYTVYERRGNTPGRELAISLSGPLSTLLIAAGLWALAAAASGPLAQILGALAFTNVLLGVLNLLPGAPLDGGALVKSAVWKLSGSEARGARAAAYAGILIAVLLAAGTIYLFLMGSDLALINLLVVGFIGFGAWQSLRTADAKAALDRVGPRVGSLLQPVLAVSDREMLAPALSRWDTTTQAAVVTVDDAGVLKRALSAPAAQAVPALERSSVLVDALSVPVADEDRAVLGADPAEVVYALARSGKSMIFVTDTAGHPLGILFASAVNAALDTP